MAAKSRLHECLTRFIESDESARRKESNPKTIREIFQMVNANQVIALPMSETICPSQRMVNLRMGVA